MKSREHIEAALTEEYNHLERIEPMDEMDYGLNQGWIEALEFVLDIDKEIKEQKAKQKRLKEIILSNKERSDIIGKAIQKIQGEVESFVDDEDSESCGVCTCGVNCS